MHRIRQIMRQPILMDARNIWDPQRTREMGFTYFGVGRGFTPNA